MAEQSVEFPQDDEMMDDLYQPLKLAPEDRKVVIGGDEFEIVAEIDMAEFEEAITDFTEISPVVGMKKLLMPILLDAMDATAVLAKINSRELGRVELLRALSPAVEKLTTIVEARIGSLKKKRRALPK